jgi:hypothetical protein
MHLARSPSRKADRVSEEGKMRHAFYGGIPLGSPARLNLSKAL